MSQLPDPEREAPSEADTAPNVDGDPGVGGLLADPLDKSHRRRDPARSPRQANPVPPGERDGSKSG